MLKVQTNDSLSITIGHGFVQGCQMLDGKECWHTPGGIVVFPREYAEEVARRIDRLINNGLRRRPRSSA